MAAAMTVAPGSPTLPNSSRSIAVSAVSAAASAPPSAAPSGGLSPSSSRVSEVSRESPEAKAKAAAPPSAPRPHSARRSRVSEVSGPRLCASRRRLLGSLKLLLL